MIIWWNWPAQFGITLWIVLHAQYSATYLLGLFHGRYVLWSRDAHQFGKNVVF